MAAQLGGAHYLNGDKVAARKHIEAALKRNRLDMHANYYMGLLEYDAKNLQKATEYLKVVARDVRYRDKVKRNLRPHRSGHVCRYKISGLALTRNAS